MENMLPSFCAQFCTEKKAELIKGLTKNDKKYLGVDRMGLLSTSQAKPELSGFQKAMLKELEFSSLGADQFMLKEKDAKNYINLFQNAGEYELIWVRSARASDTVPNGYNFIGFDVSMEPRYSGAISLVKELFTKVTEKTKKYFGRLNDCGLFSSIFEAEDYMNKCKTESLLPASDFYIYEIYKK